MLSRTKRELRATEDKIVEKAAEAQAIMDLAGSDNRTRTDDENADVAELHKAIQQLTANKRELEDQVDLEESVQNAVSTIDGTADEKGVVLHNGMNSVSFPRREQTAGEIFVNSSGYKSMYQAVKETGHWPQGMKTGAIAIETKGTLLEGTGAPGSGTGGGLIPVPDEIPGVVQKLFQPLSVTDLILSGTTTVSTVRYIVEGTATSGAAGVAEGGSKPQSTLALSTRDESVRKIATSLKVSSEMLEDASQTRAYIDGRLSLFVGIEQERQVVRGAGTNDLVGIMDSTRGINIYAGGTAAGNKAVQLFKAMNGQRGSALIEPDWFLIHPTDYQDLRLLTDTAGQFFGGGPFQGPYGNGSNLASSGQITQATDHIWNKPVVVTTAVGGAGTALIGTSSAAQLFSRSGLTVEATNSNEDDFLKNLVAIRAEKRQALAVYRPTAFTEVRLA
jgi:HK97 family phage major capsid protein